MYALLIFNLFIYIQYYDNRNICVWPAEPILLHTLCNIPQFIELIKDKRILEIGGGLTSLAGNDTYNYYSNITYSCIYSIL